MFLEAGSVLDSTDSRASDALRALIMPVALLLDQLVAAKLLGRGDPNALTFIQFDTYDFDADQSFQQGVAGIMEGGAAQDGFNAHATLLQAKAFYYNKMIGPFDVEAYAKWKAAGATETAAAAAAAAAAASTSPPASSAVPAAALATPLASDQAAAAAAAATASDGGDDGSKLSFEEVMALVAAGKEVPGCKKVEVHIQEGVPPTESTMSRPKKPWEVAVGAGAEA